jgi:hypothetical protein
MTSKRSDPLEAKIATAWPAVVSFFSSCSWMRVASVSKLSRSGDCSGSAFALSLKTLRTNC